MLSNNCSILLIDDDADVLDAYTQLLEQAGYHVSACNFGVPSFIASNYVCDRVLHWYEGNQHAPLNGVMSFFHK
ncbi:TPA: hypothetical protein L9363_000437 [Klebsiella pneumoniae]|nr:hypothetical protein [Klebsiella pneumoniae]HBR7492835.1 hypothetical protein [Klebsiella pneumoniae]HBR7509510.1 hypothetical protein [Klebsiella pneumoniae]